jgi:hypothetical protein
MKILRFILIFLLSFGIQLAANQPIPYSGKISIRGVNYDGDAQFTFSLVDKNGKVYWRNGSKDGETIKVNVSNGYYTVLLGGQGMNILPPQLFLDNEELYLKVHFDNVDGQGLRHLGPNQRIAATPRALVADISKYSLNSKSSDSVKSHTIDIQMLAPSLKVYFEQIDVVDGLVGWWPFDGNASDMSGNNNDGTVHGATLTSDRNNNPNSAYSFSGNEWIDTANLVSNYDNLTFSAWFLAKNTSGNNFRAIISKPRLAAGTGSVFGFVFPSQKISGGIHQSSGSITAQSSIYFNQWYFGAYTNDGNNVKLYLDGKLSASTSYNSSITPSTQNLLIGKELHSNAGDTQRYFNGYIDDVRVYNRALLHNEIEILFKDVL